MLRLVSLGHVFVVDSRTEAYSRNEPRKSTSFHFLRGKTGRNFLSGHVRRNRRAEAPPMGPLEGKMWSVSC